MAPNYILHAKNYTIVSGFSKLEMQMTSPRYHMLTQKMWGID